MEIKRKVSMISGISFTSLYPFKQAGAINTTNKLEKSPKYDCVSFCSTSKGEIPSDIKKILDNKVFTFEKDDGKIFKGTIKDYINNSIIGTNDINNGFSLIHCTSSKEVGTQILRKGLDWTKTSRMKCGPGTYFLPSMAGGMEQGGGSVAIEGRYIGNKRNFTIFEPNFYTAIDDNIQINDAVKNRYYVNKYCHDYLEKDLGIDILYASSGRGVGSFVVVNDKCMRLSRYGW